jgi:hypothetical protein
MKASVTGNQRLQFLNDLSEADYYLRNNDIVKARDRCQEALDLHTEPTLTTKDYLRLGQTVYDLASASPSSRPILDDTSELLCNLSTNCLARAGKDEAARHALLVDAVHLQMMNMKCVTLRYGVESEKALNTLALKDWLEQFGHPELALPMYELLEKTFHEKDVDVGRPLYVRVVRAYAELLVECKMYPEACKKYAWLIKNRPDIRPSEANSDTIKGVHAPYAECLMLSGDYKGAIKQCQYILANNSSPDVKLVVLPCMAACNFKSGNRQLAAKQFEEEFELVDHLPNQILSLPHIGFGVSVAGGFAQENGSPAIAEKIFAKQVDVARRQKPNPSGPESIDFCGKLHKLGCILEIEGKYEKASAAFAEELKVIERFSNNVDGDATAGAVAGLYHVARESKKFDEARTYGERLAKIFDKLKYDDKAKQVRGELAELPK